MYKHSITKNYLLLLVLTGYDCQFCLVLIALNKMVFVEDP